MIGGLVGAMAGLGGLGMAAETAPRQMSSSCSGTCKTPSARQTLSLDQQRALDAVREGRHIFLTGPPGTGKTHATRAIVGWAQEAGKNVGITAMTGTAAVLLGGQTVHSYLGIGLARGSPEAMAAQLSRGGATARARILALDLLLLDEVSMASAEFLDKVSDFLGIVRRRHGTPFGGVQVVLVGDFCQLPPVEGRYAFHARVWAGAGIQTIQLETNHRQQGDVAFQDLLGALRRGRCGAGEMETLRGLCDRGFPSGVSPAVLYATNADVDAINQGCFEELVGKGAPVQAYPLRHAKGASGKTAEGWARSAKLDAPVRICLGARVMLTRNVSVEQGLVNGSQGIVLGLDQDRVLVRFHGGEAVWIGYFRAAQEEDTRVWIEYMPLRLAWAVSIHRSQGATLDAVSIDLGTRVFAPGQAYTALSRARGLDGVRLLGLSPRAFFTSPEVMAFYGYDAAAL